MSRNTILLVDNDVDSRAIYAAILHHYSYRVLEAGDGEAGLRLAHESAPQAVVLDLALPRLGGLAVAERLKGAPQTAEIPVIVLTARVLDTDRARALEAGCDRFLTKPCPPRLLLEEVQRVMGVAPPAGLVSG